MYVCMHVCMYVCMYVCIHVYIYIYIFVTAPRNHLLVRIVKPSRCHCTDGHLTSRVFTEDQKISQCAEPPLGALPLSLIVYHIIVLIIV